MELKFCGIRSAMEEYDMAGRQRLDGVMEVVGTRIDAVVGIFSPWR